MTLAFLISAALAQCPEASRAIAPSRAAAGIEAGARRAAGDLCPDHAAAAAPGQTSELLEKIRARTLPKLRERAARERAGDASGLMRQFDRMRQALARARAEVTFVRGVLTIQPAVRLTPAPGAATLAPLTPAENDRLQAEYAGRLRDVRTADRAAATRFRDELRRGGQAEYEAAIAAEPALMFVEEDRDVYAARERYQKSLAAEGEALPRLTLWPPGDEALALIYLGPVVTEVLRESPELCGAFRELKSRADRLARRHDVAKVGLDLAANAGCTALGFVVRSKIAFATCVGLGVQDLADQMGAARYQERRLLYGDLSSSRNFAYTY